jgi:hypothetical protein
VRRAAQTRRFGGGRIAVADCGFPIVCDADTAQRCMTSHASKVNGLVTSDRRLPVLSLPLSLPPSPPQLQVSPLFNLQLPPLRTERNQAAAYSSTDPPPLQLFLLLTPASPLPHRFRASSRCLSEGKSSSTSFEFHSSRPNKVSHFQFAFKSALDFCFLEF